jgi:hypothetical protein
MCQRVYIASKVELPRVRRGKRNPYLNVQAVSDTRVFPEGVRGAWPHLHVAGGHVTCGCGFPSETATGEPDPKKLAAEDVASLNALVEYIRPACTKGKAVLIYLCWQGCEDEPPESIRAVSLEEMQEMGFRLKHKQVLTVGGDQTVGVGRRLATASAARRGRAMHSSGGGSLCGRQE